jgi:hypothetical protein
VDIPQDNSNKDNSDNNSGQNGEGEARKPASSESAAAPAQSQLPVNDEAPAASAASDAMKDLPVVDAPSLDGAEAEVPAAEPATAFAKPEATQSILALASDAINDESDEAPAIELAAARQPRSLRFALLAASIAFAAGFGAFVGALATAGMARHQVAEAQAPRMVDARGVQQGLKAELAELNALKSSLDSANRGANAQFAKIADRLASLERQQADPAKLQRLAEAVDRLDKRATAEPEITGSIAKPAEPAPAAPAAPAAAPPPAATAHILNDWIVRDVRGGRALIESRYGGLFVVGSGGNLPGLGRVESVRRQDGAWMVLTAKGTITSDR